MPALEKHESGSLNSVGSILGVLLTVIIITILFIGTCTYQIERRGSKGKAWCESVISEYEADREKFLEVHSNKLHHGNLNLRPSPEYKGARGNFSVDSTGEYTCLYLQTGLHGYEYSSKTREWIHVN